MYYDNIFHSNILPEQMSSGQELYPKSEVTRFLCFHSRTHTHSFLPGSYQELDGFPQLLM